MSRVARETGLDSSAPAKGQRATGKDRGRSAIGVESETESETESDGDHPGSDSGSAELECKESTLTHRVWKAATGDSESIGRLPIGA